MTACFSLKRQVLLQICFFFLSSDLFLCTHAHTQILSFFLSLSLSLSPTHRDKNCPEEYLKKKKKKKKKREKTLSPNYTKLCACVYVFNNINNININLNCFLY